MKLPILKHHLDLRDYFKNQYVDDRALSRWLLLKSMSFNKIIIKPYLRSFAEVPKLVINDNLTTYISGLWILHEGDSSKVILGDGSLLRFYAKTYFAYNDMLINVYSDGVSLYDLRSNEEEWILKSFKGVAVEGFYGPSLVLTKSNGTKYLISPLIRKSPIEVDYVRYYESKTTSLLVFKRDRKLFALLNHKNLNIHKLYELSKCHEVNDVLVGDCLGFINCVEGSYLISFNNLLRIPLNAFPLVDIGGRYLLHSQQHNLLMEFNGKELRPLIFAVSPRVVGYLPGGELIIILNSRPYILNNNIWRLISDLRVIDGSVGTNYIAFRTPNSLELFSVNAHMASYKLMDCSIINDALVCVYEGKVLIYDLTDLRDLYVGIEANSSMGYPRLVIMPWSKPSQLIIKGPIILLSNPLDNDLIKEYSIKPIKLGVEISFKAIIDFMLTKYSNIFKVMVNRPEVLDLKINEVKYSINGRLYNGDDNLLIKYFLSIYNPLPEELKVIINYVEGNQIVKSRSHILRPGRNELELEDSLRIFSNTLQLLIEYEWINRSEVLAAYTIDLTEHLINDPYSIISYSLEYIDECRYKLTLTNSVNKEIPVSVQVTCADGRKFNGINSVVIEECSLPAVLEFSYGIGAFHWVKRQLINSSNLVLIDVKSSNELNVKVDLIRKCVNGFVDNEIKLKISEVNPLRKLLLVPSITSEGVKIKLIYEFLNDSTLIALVGNAAYVSKGLAGEISLDLNNLVNDIVVIVLGNGVRDVYVIKYSEILRKCLELACGVALHLKNLIINW